MNKRRHKRRGISLGTIIMLTLVALVLIGFSAILPKLTGNTDVRIDAAELAVAIDQSVSELISAADKNTKNTALTQATILPPESLTLSSTAAQPAQPTTPPTLTFSLCAAGSIEINSNVQKALSDDSGYRFSMLFEQLGTAMDADFTIATLENNVIPDSKLSNSNIPQIALSAISQAGVDALSVGYYGILEGGMEGLVQTKSNITSAGMLPYGVHTSEAERHTPVITNVNGVSVALFNYQDDLSSASKKKVSKEELAYAIVSKDPEIITADIKAAKQAGAQVIIVSLCWGKANATSPTKAQQELAQQIADAGADIILGTHSDPLQTIEILTANRGDDKYHPTLCAYSLGNLFTHNRDARANLTSILLHTDVVYNIGTDSVAFDNLTYTPIYTWRGKEDDVTRYRVLVNDGTYPEFVDANQQKVMVKCYDLITKVMQGTPVALK